MIDQNIVKNVILDLGGVLVDIEPEYTISALKRIIEPEFHNILDWENSPEVVYNMEVGNWDLQQFFNHFKAVCKPSIIEEEIIDAWNAMLLEFPRERVKMLRKLGKKYNLYLLSNTNSIHVKCFESDFKNRYNYPLKKLFREVYYSSEIGLRKPDTSCFQHVIQLAGLNVEETVMVDDRLDNCLAAEAVGMKSLKVPDKSGLEAVIKQLI